MTPPVPTMTPAEFVERAKSMFGIRWRNPVARLIGRSPRMVMFYVEGCPIPPAIAEKLRQAADLGPNGTIIRDVIRRSVRELRPYESHLLAKGILDALTEAGAFGTDQEPTQRRINWHKLRRIVRS